MLEEERNGMIQELEKYKVKQNSIIKSNLDDMRDLAVNEAKKDELKKGEMAFYCEKVSEEFRLMEEKRIKENKTHYQFIEKLKLENRELKYKM